MSQTFTFQAETQQLLHILIHSLYSERDIFLRELLSNASDALNRFQFEQLTNSDVLDPELPLAIRIVVDETAGTLTISDTGIGMTREEIIENLGTIARSGARHFIEAIKDAPDQSRAQDIIGQFGVGFYSVFMAADRVRVVSRSYQPNAEAVAWEASGGTTYTLEPAEKATRGTDIVVHLKEDAKEFLQTWKLREVIKRHSDYVAFPITLGEDETPVNSQQAIWRKAPKDVEDEDYNRFYQQMTLDFVPPVHRLHLRADVPLQFYALLYVPASAEPNMFSLRKEPGLKLYARKVLIQEYNKDLLPEYLQFVQGVVDSEDLPLNVNRESIRSDRVLARLKGTITKRIIGDFKRLAEHEREQFLTIYQAFGRFLKQGMVVSAEDREELQSLLFFPSTHDKTDALHSLSEYADRMAEGQTEIYYIIADDLYSARRSPHLEPFRRRGVEVLFFVDPVDAMLPMGLAEYRGHRLRSVDEADIDLTDVGQLSEEEATPRKEALASDRFEAVRDRFKALLAGRVNDVRSSNALVGSPARLVSDEGGTNRHMYRINRLLDREYELPVKTLELNPHHPLIHNLAGLLADDPQHPVAMLAIEQVFETALLQEGLHPDPAAMADRLTALLQAATGSSLEEIDLSILPDPASSE